MTVRVRFPPSPTGDLHVGNVRSALFNYAFARHHGGTFVLRIEDTDRARSSQESYRSVLEDLRWLGLDWDEGPEVGGPHAPYVQSERLPIYADIAARLLVAGEAYRCYCTPDEAAARAKAAGRPPGYDGHCRALSSAQRTAYEARGRAPLLRLRMPGTRIAFDDLIRGEVAFAPEHVPDYALVRADGSPLYPLVNPVDDALMGITHVLRGEDLLSSTPRQIALYDALRRIGVLDTATPAFGHLPFVLGEGNAKLSKRTPGGSLSFYRAGGFLPEALLNYLALLGWSMGGDVEEFSLAEMVAAFTLDRVSRNPARFDLTKAEAINGDWIRRLEPDDLADRLRPVLVAAGVVLDEATLAAAVPLVQTRMRRLTEAAGLLGFLADGDGFAVDAAAAAKVLAVDAAPTLDAALRGLEPLPEWTAEAVAAVVRSAVVDGLGLKPRVAYAPLRVAITGRTVAPPLFESMALLGRERTLQRLAAAYHQLSGSRPGA